MMLLYIIMIILGITLMGWCFWASNRANKPLDLIGAILLPVALIITLLGVLLTCVPDFFKG